MGFNGVYWGSVGLRGFHGVQWGSVGCNGVGGTQCGWGDPIGFNGVQWGSMGRSGVGALTAVEPVDFGGHSALRGVAGQHHGVALLHLHRGHFLLRPLRGVCGAAMGWMVAFGGGGGGAGGSQRCGVGPILNEGNPKGFGGGSSKTPMGLGWPRGGEGNPKDLGGPQRPQ